ncbi:DNA-binding protein [Lysobacter sp. HA18]
MGRLGLTQDDVFEVCDALLRVGERPTQQNVRARLGTGSMSTIQRSIDVWWAGLASRLETAAVASRQPEVPGFVQDAAERIWRGALQAAAEAAEAEIAQRRATLNADRDAFAAERTALDAELASARAARAQADQGRANAEARSVGLELALTTAGERLADAIARLEATTSAQADLQNALSTARAQTETTRAEWAAHDAEAQAHIRALEDRAHAEVDRARQAQKAAEDALRRVQAQSAETEWRLREELAEMTRHQGETAQSAAVVRAERDRLVAEVESLRTLLEQALRAKAQREPARKAPPKKRPAKTAARRD